MPGGLFWLSHQAYQGYDASTSGDTFTQAVAALSPTAHWTLGEASGTAAADQMGTHGGTYVNTPTLGVSAWASDTTGATFTRDAINLEGVQVTDHADNDLGTSDFSILLAVDNGAWYTSDYQGWFTKGTGNPFLIGTNATTNRLSIYLVDTDYTLDLSTDITDGWHLLLITCDRDGLASVFVDGGSTAEDTVDISAKSATSLDAAADLYLARGEGSYPFGGSLQHIAYWKGTLISGSQFATLYAARNGTGTSSGGGGGATQADTYVAAVLALGGGPDAYYKMDEGSGVTTMADSSTTANNGTYHASPTMGGAGPFSGAPGVTFDGSTQYASAPYTSALDAGTGDFSILLWIKTSDTWVNWEWLVARPGEGYDTLELFTGQNAASQLASRFTNTAETDTAVAKSSATATINDGAWHMVGMSADRTAGLARFWLDGAAYGTQDISLYAHTLTGTNVLYLARRSLGSYWGGSMCQVAIWSDYLLTSGNVADLWTAAGN